MSTNVKTDDLKTLDDGLNALILGGQVFEALERFYDRDVAMQENSEPPTVGLGANLEREKAFFATVETWHGSKILATAVGDGVTFGEWENDATYKGAPRAVTRQVSIRRWRNGKIVHERFVYAK
jgi:hypothetical protein